MKLDDIKIMLIKGAKGDKGDGSYDDTELRELIASTFADVQEEISQLEQNYLNYMYPVGSIYISVGETSPAVLFGGTWEQIKDRFLLSSGDTYSSGATGGSAKKSFNTDNHTLTINEMPSHLHEMARVNTSGAGTHDGIAKGTGSLDEFSTQTMGNGQGHNHSVTNIDIMPPYLVVNVWKRTA
jgi:hypothetical protein